ncbi:MAG: gliding motility-associated C-terminal domain-containing protein [Cryomorphaceae bacterium]|nr:gliding motility-associated C-terminal domain-containing protein [Cryomorphaceae bacterium]
MFYLQRKYWSFFLVVFCISGWAQVNVAPLATVTASTCNVGTCAAFNNQNLGTCGLQQVWVSTANPPSLVPGVNFIEWNWTIPYTMNQMTIHHGNQFIRFLTGATIQYWDGTAWINHHTFSNLPMLCSNTFTFPTINTNRMRITSFQMTGTGQTSNPNFREIEIFMTSSERNDAGVSDLLNENSLCVGNNNLSFRIQNYGVNTIDSVMLNWQVNGGPIQSQWVIASINSMINAPPPHFADVTVGPATILSGANSILAWTSLPNDTVDGNLLNDSLNINLTPGISGNYTINSLLPTAGTNFNSFTELANYLNINGICGPLVVDVAPGGSPYTERVVFLDIPGSSIINTITINGNGNTLTHDSPNSALRSTLTLNEVKHMTIDSLIIEATANNFGWAMHLTNSSDSNSFTRCQFLSNNVNYTAGTCGVVISSSPTNDFSLGDNGSNISFDQCLFSGGRYGLIANGIALNIMTQNLSITNSEFRNSSDNGMRIRGFEQITIEGNIITRENRNDARTFYSIFLQNCQGNIKVSKNRIYGLNGLNLITTAIVLTNVGSTINNPIEISNNLIYGLDNLQSTSGIEVTAGTTYHLKILHNTVVLNNLKANGTTTVRAFRVGTASSTCTYDFLNNIVILGGNSNNNRVYLLTGLAAGVSNIDNNVYFRIANTGAQIGTIQNTNYPNFPDWQAAGYDPNGAFTNPDFLGMVGQSDFYRPTNLSLLGMGTNLLSRVPDDIENASRNATPDPGAFNILKDQAPFDVGVAQLLYPDTVCNDSAMLGIRIRNYGTEIIDSVMVSWQVNGGAIQSTWVSGPIDTINSISGPFLDVTVGPANFPGASTNTVTTWTSLPNNQTDTITSNDTNNAIVISRLSGTVTINPNQPTGLGNFNSFTDFAQEVNTNGICGPVIVNVAPGSPAFSERIVFNQISGMSAINTITINGNGNTLSYTAAFSLERTTLVLNGTDHLTINDLTIEASGANFAWVTQLYNTADSNTFNNCYFKAPQMQGTTGILGVVFSGSLTGNGVAGNNGNFNVFNGCTMEGGMAGVTLLGGQTQECLNNEFLNCTFINFFQHGIRAVMQRNFIVKNCDFSCPNINHNSAFMGFGAVFGTNINASIFYGNRIHNTNDPLSNNLQLGATGFTMNPGGNANYTDTSEILFANNLFYNFINRSATYGISIGTDVNNSIKIFHNTFAFEHPKANQNIMVHGIHFGLNVTKYQIENNLFYLNAGSNNQRGLFFNQYSPSPERIINYNTYFLFNNQGRIATANNTNYNTLVDWQATNNDLNGYFADPQFLRAIGTSDFYRPTNALMIGIGNNLFSQIPDDIEGTARTTSPDPGAFNIITNRAAFDAGINELIFPDTVCGDSTMLTLRITNFGSTILDSVQVSWQTNGGAVQTVWVQGPIDTIGGVNSSSLTASVGPATLIPATANSLKAWTSLPNNQNDTVNSNDTLNTTIQTLLSGTVTINPAQPTGIGNFNSFTDFANEVNTNGICGPVIVNVAPGSPTFSERIVFNQISGMSAINTITINGNGNTLSHTASVSNQRATLLLNGTDHMTIDSLIVEASGSNFGYAMQLTNQADSNTFFRCSFLVDENAVSINFIPVVISGNLTLATAFGDNANYNTFENCTMNGGNSGVIMFGSPTIFNRGNVLRNNTVRNFTINGIRVSHQEDLTLEHNDVSRIDKNVTNAFTGFAISNTQGTTRIYGNRIHGTRHPSSTANIGAIGISYALNQNLDSTNVTLIANNLLYNFNNRGITRGFRIFGNPAANTFTQPVYVLHNTIVFEEAAANINTAVRAIEIFGNFANHTVANNLLYLETGSNNQVGLFFNLTTTSVNRYLDYNTFYLHNNIGGVATLGTNVYNTLAQWQATGNGINSLVFDPDFLSNVGTSDYYRPTSQNILGVGMDVLSLVPDDIEFAPRSTSPDPGAFNIIDNRAEFDAGIDELIFPDTVCGDSTMLTLQVVNYGTTILDSVLVSWQMNGGAIQTTWVHGPIDTLGGANPSFISAIVGPSSLLPVTANVLKAWTSLPNNQNDTVNSNDTLNASIQTLLSGIATIDPTQPTGQGNFNSFTDFALEVNTNGICGPVIVNVAPGSPTFNERIVFNQISGMSAINTITINGNNNTLSNSATTPLERTTLVLNGTDHLTINDLNIEATGANFAWVMQLYNTADSNSFNNCYFKAPIMQGTTSVMGVVFSGSLTGNGVAGNNGNYNVFDSCTVEGGLDGVTLLGNQTQECLNNEFLNSTFINFFQFGIRAVMQRNFVVKNCEFSCPNINHTSPFINFIAISATNINASTIYANRIHTTNHPLSNNTNLGASGIVINPGFPNNSDTSTILIANNLFHDFINLGFTYGIQVGININNKLEIYHNTIAFEHPKNNQNVMVGGINIVSNSNPFNIENNLFYLNTGSNNQTAITIGQLNPTSQRIVNYNTFYLFNNQGSIARANNFNYNTLAAWQGVNNDLNGFYSDPQFFRTLGASDYYRPSNPQLIGIGKDLFSQIPDDIEAAPRTTTPDPGAFNIVFCDSAPDIPHFADTTVLVCGSSDSIVVHLTPDSNATSYHWILPTGWSGSSDADTILIWNINEHDTVFVYAENPCGLSDTLAIPIIRMDATLQASSLQICLGDTVDIGLLQTPHPTTDVQWNVGGSATSISVSPTENTTYAITLSKDGKSCIDSISIDVIIPDTTQQTIQACDEYLWPADSLVYTSSGVYSTTLSALNGCDSIVILDLTIDQSDSTTLNVTECDAYFWDASGQTYNITGTYIATLSNQQGCDSVVTLNLDILNSDSIVQMEVSCDSYFWPVSNQSYDTSGVYTEVYPKSNGCDSTHVLILTIHPSYSVSQNEVACDSFVWAANNQVYTISGTYTDTLTTLSGCDSIVTLTLTINQSSSATETITACDVYVWGANNQSYNASGNYTAVVPNAVGCDSTITLDLTILQSDTISQTQSACDTYFWPVNNQSYAASGVYFETFTKSNGCDSVMVLNLTIFPSSVTTQNIAACDSFVWPVNNQTYTASGTYVDTILSSAGCDSVINLELTINQYTTGTLSITACDSYTWPDNNQTYTNSGVYTSSITNAVGCDSVVTLTLQINSSDTILQTVTECETYTWPVNNQAYTTSGIYQETFTNAGGCDSIHILNLQIAQPDSIVINQVACDEFTWIETGLTYTQSGIYSVTYSNNAGCDSVILLVLSVNSAVQIHQEATACDEYQWPINGQVYTESGTYSQSFISGSGCDSVVKLHLSIYPSAHITERVTASLQYYWPINGTTYNKSGTYQHTLQTQHGCDSVLELDLTIQDGSTLYIPNAFSPNGNGINEVFKVLGNEVSTFQIVIYNRFGQLIFESKDIEISWDGTFLGEPAPMGNYVYRIDYSNTVGEYFIRRGNILLIR